MRRVLALLVLSAAAAAARDPVVEPGEQLPEWAQQGRFRFARVDGGPIEIVKTARSEWGRHFNVAEKEVLANVYTKYSGRLVELLQQARVNWVWITWSAGFSWADEEVQRQQCRTMIAKLHEKKIRVAAYVCATTIFWESMFRDEPRSVRWLSFDRNGAPFRYSGGRDTFRFIADVRNPEWLEYSKRRIGAAIDAGVDGFFIDNTSNALWNGAPAMDAYIAALRRYIREEKHSAAVLLSNYGLSPERAAMNRNMEVVFNEYWREPGVWGDDWDISNVRRMRYVRGLVPDWKPLMSEYSNFHGGNRSTAILSPRSTRLAIAEAAAFRSSYTWNMEGPFYHGLMTNAPAAMETWNSIARYNGFLAEHEDLYRGARGVAAIAVVLGDRQRAGASINFGWSKEDSGLLDALSKASVMYDLRLMRATTEAQLANYAAVVVPSFTELTPADEEMLGRFRAKGGRVMEASGPADVARIRALAPGAPSVAVESAAHVAANLTRRGENGPLVLHLLNYDPEPASAVRVRIGIGDARAGKPRLLTPDSGTHGLGRVKRSARDLEFTLDALDTYAVVAFDEAPRDVEHSARPLPHGRGSYDVMRRDRKGAVPSRIFFDGSLRPRLVVMTDISTLTADTGEPDDTQSLIRLLLYSNHFDIEGLLATHTSNKVPHRVNPQFIHAIVDEYGKVRDNLLLHDRNYPPAQYLHERVKAGSEDRSAVGPGHDTEASDWIVSVVGRPDPRPVWFTIWGGARELAQALWKVDQARSPAQVKAFESKLRVYAVNDQDGTGKWIAEHHPGIFYIAAADNVRGMYRNGDTALVGPEWVEARVRNGRGPLGAAYPNYRGGDPWGRVRGVKEGDTPSFLYLIPNGLGDPERPELGSWGGRFSGPGPRYLPTQETWEGETSLRAAVFRWRAAYQNSFAARLEWCVRPYRETNHEPVAAIAGARERVVKPGARLTLDARASRDPDGNRLTYTWEIYPEGGGTLRAAPGNPARAVFTAPSSGVSHILLTVTDSGSPPLAAYRRVTVRVAP